MKVAKTCIFCGLRGNISKEHFWSEWLAPHIEKGPEGSYFSELHTAEGQGLHRLTQRRERQGEVFTIKIRAVCRSCNSGWMNEIENQSRPAFIDLFQRKSLELSAESASALATWVALKVMVVEHAAPNQVLTTSDDRHLFYQEKTIPSYFRTFVGYHSLTTQAAFQRQSTSVSKTMAGPDPALPAGVTRNIQTVCFLIGPLFFYVVCARVKDFDLAVLDPAHGMLKIWPEDNGSNSRPIACLARADIAVLTNKLNDLITNPRVRYGGPIPNGVVHTP